MPLPGHLRHRSHIHPTGIRRGLSVKCHSLAETDNLLLYLESLLIALTVVPALCGILVPKEIRPESENAVSASDVPALEVGPAHRALDSRDAVVLFAAAWHSCRHRHLLHAAME